MSKRYTEEEVNDVFAKEGYTLLDSFKGKKVTEKLKVICPQGHEYETTFINFRRGKRCRVCFMERFKRSGAYILEDVINEIKNNNFKIIKQPEEYTNVYDAYFELECKKGHLINTTFANLKYNNDYKCVYCNAENYIDTRKFTEEQIIEGLQNEDYKFVTWIEEHINAQSMFTVKCPNGHIYNTCWNYFQQNFRCPHCNETRGEKKTRSILENNSIYFKPQYRFKDCKDKYTLPFDFAILDKLDKVLCLVEYDGEGHYQPVKYNGISDKRAMAIYENTKYKDGIKNDYCKRNNIKLIRIPYWEFDNIEKILKEHQVI